MWLSCQAIIWISVLVGVLQVFTNPIIYVISVFNMTLSIGGDSHNLSRWFCIVITIEVLSIYIYVHIATKTDISVKTMRKYTF